MKRLWGVLSLVLLVGVAAPVAASAHELNDSARNDSQTPGSVIVFPKFVAGSVDTPDQGTLPATQVEISVTCPKGSVCAHSTAAGVAGPFQEVALRAHWVCPGDSANVCAQVDFNLRGKVNGTIVFSPDGSSAPQPPCDQGYLIAWVVDGEGRPIKADALIGDAVIRGSPTSARAYNALPIQAAAFLATGDPTDVNGDGRLAFDGSEYQAIAGKILGSVQFESAQPEIQTFLTLLTLDVFSNQQNDPTTVDLNFYNAFEALTSTQTNFTCWQQVRLTDINSSLNTFDQSSAKGLVESTAAVQSAGPVTLVGLVETQEGFKQSVETAGTKTLVIPFPVDINNLPNGCRVVSDATGAPVNIKCKVHVSARTEIPGIREYAYSLYNDGTPVATTFGPQPISPDVLRVENYGVDNETCGLASAPCRSISQAIANASDGDRIVVGPGTYGVGVEAIEGFPGCVCMIKIDKSLTLVSRDGAEVTVLDVGNADVRGVVIEANSVVFGERDKGFTIANARREGVLLDGATSGVTVQGNVAVGNGANGNDAFKIQGSAHTVAANEARNNARSGFGIAGSEHTVTGNLASNNLQGAEVTFSGEFTRNAIVGNNLDGLVVNAVRRGLLIHRNDILSNGQSGVRIQNPFDGTITQNNIFGNASIAGNCGLLNQSGGVVNAPENFWGASSGPGPDPADAVCEDPGSVTLVDPVATKEFNIRAQD